MEFKRYNSITNSYDEEFIQKVQSLKYTGAWFVSEKIHGANCQLCVDQECFKIGGRNDFTDDDLWEKVLFPYEEAMTNLCNYIKAKRIILYGELFGGSYPHPNVPRDKAARKIQKGVWYSPSNHVLFYDLFIVPFEGNGYYAPVVTFEVLMDRFNLPRVNFKKVKSLKEALKYPNDGPSKVYRRYDLPEIEGNIMEGIVIKPSTTLWLGQTRVIIKSKNDRFKEVWRERKPIVDQKELTEKQIEVLEDMLRFVTENRAVSILSHYGSSKSMKVLGPLIKDMNTEVIQEFEKQNNVFNSMEKGEIKEITRRVNKKVSEICKKVLNEQIKGE